MDRAERVRIGHEHGRATWGRGRAVRLDHDAYRSDVPTHFVICADAGCPFAAADVAEMVCDALEQGASQMAFRLYCYCLMPDHLHVVLSPGESGASSLEWLRRFKSYTTNQYQRMTGGRKLWQDSARDRLKRLREDLRTLVEYVANNPVRARLVARWTDYPYVKVAVEL